MSPLFALAGLFAGTRDIAQGGTLTLAQALAYADKNAFEILIQQTRVEKQRQQTEAERGKLGPTLTLNGNYTRYDQATTANFNGNTVTILPIQQLNGQVSAAMPLDISGNMHRLIRASRASTLAQGETLQADRADTRQAVRSAYLAILRAQGQVTVAQESLDSDTARAKNAEQRYKAGILAQVDVMRAQTQQAQSESNLIAATNGVELAKQDLNRVIARPIETTFDVVDVPNPSETHPDPAELTKVAETTRHEAKALSMTVKSLEDTLSYVQHSNNPTLNLGVTYTDNAKPIGFGQRPQVGAGTVSFNWPILDSGFYRAEVRAARQDVAQAQLQLEQVRLEISLEVRQATTNLTNAEARATVADREVATARVALQQAALRHDQGIGILLEVIESQRDLTNAEFAQVTAKYDVLQALADLQRAIGSDSIPG